MFCYIYWTHFDKLTCVPILEVSEQLGDLLTKAKIRNKAKMLPHLIEKIDPAQLPKAKYRYIRGIEHNGDIYVYICGGYKVKCDSKLDAVSKSIMLYYIFHVEFPPAAKACYKFLAGLFGVPYTNTNEAALMILHPEN